MGVPVRHHLQSAFTSWNTAWQETQQLSTGPNPPFNIFKPFFFQTTPFGFPFSIGFVNCYVKLQATSLCFAFKGVGGPRGSIP